MILLIYGDHGYEGKCERFSQKKYRHKKNSLSVGDHLREVKGRNHGFYSQFVNIDAFDIRRIYIYINIYNLQNN